jgi:hypothetical protein
MVASTDGKQDFMQVGYFETYGRGTHHFNANELESKGSGYTEYDDWGHTIGPNQTYQYAVTKVENNGGICYVGPRFDCMTSLINGVVWGPPSYWEWYALPQPYDDQFYGESWYFTTDVPGSVTHAQTANMAYMDATYHRYPIASSQLYSYDNNSYWYRQSGLGAGPTFSIWDGPCC